MKKKLTTIEILSDFESTPSGEGSIQSGVIKACRMSVHINGYISWITSVSHDDDDDHDFTIMWNLRVSDLLTFPLYSFQQPGQHGRRSLWKGELLGQVQQTEGWKRRRQLSVTTRSSTRCIWLLSVGYFWLTINELPIYRGLLSQRTLQFVNSKDITHNSKVIY